MFGRPLSCSSSRKSSIASSISSMYEESIYDGVEMEASSKGKIKGSIAMHYFRAGANWFWIFVVFSFFILAQLFASVADYWVSVW